MGGNASKIVIIAIALCAAAAIFYVTNKPEKADQPAVEVRDLVCVEGGTHFTLTPEEYERRYAEAPAREPKGGSQSGARTRRGDSRPKLIPCPECDGGDALLGAKCPDSDTWYPVIMPDGSRGSCPD